MLVFVANANISGISKIVALKKKNQNIPLVGGFILEFAIVL